MDNRFERNAHAAKITLRNDIFTMNIYINEKFYWNRTLILCNTNLHRFPIVEFFFLLIHITYKWSIKSYYIWKNLIVSVINFILIKNIAIQYHHVLLLFWIEVKYNVGKTYILLIWHVVWPLSSVCRSNSSDTALSCRGQDRELTLTNSFSSYSSVDR